MTKFVLVSLLFFGILTGSDVTSKLQYLTHVPVGQIHTIQIQMGQKLPGLDLKGRHQQIIRTEIKIYGDQSESNMTHPPFDLSFTLKELIVDMKINDKGVVYDTNEKSQTVENAQLKKVVNRPVLLHFDQGFVFNPESKEIKKIIQDLPVLDEIQLPKILKEIFLYVFALAGKDLKVGANFTIEIPLGLSTAMPLFLNYEVTKIDENKIQANISGTIDAESVQLNNKLKMQSSDEPVIINFKGKFQGVASWNRQNALLMQMESKFDIKGNIKIVDLEWPLDVQGAMTTKSQLAPQP